MTAPAPHEHEQPPTGGALAAALATASAAGAGYAATEVARATLAALLRRLKLPRQAATGLLNLHTAAPTTPIVGLTPQVAAQAGHAHSYRAAYLAKAARRLLAAAKPSTPGSVADALGKERRYLAAHRTAVAARQQAALRVDAAAHAYGPLLGWYAVDDDRTTPECRDADGRNFDPTRPPAIGLPGLKHAGRCRCVPGPAHEGAAMVGDPVRWPTPTAVPEVIAASRIRQGVIEMGSRASLDRSPRKNWVENSGGLPPYVREIARSIEREQGKTLSEAIRLALGAVRRWAAGGGDVTPAVRAKATAALAQWQATRARNAARQLPRTSLNSAALIVLARQIRRRQLIDLAWDESRHPRIPRGMPGGGRFVSATPNLLSEIRERGGFTYDPIVRKLIRPGEPGASGFAVAVPGTERLLGGPDMTADQLEDAILDVIESDREAFRRGDKIGGWFSEERNQFMVEQSQVQNIPRDAAVALGQARNQEAILDMATGEFIDTGGTGG